MKLIGKNDHIPTREDRDKEDYEPIFTVQEVNEPVTLELTRPIEIDGVEVSELTITPPNARSMLRARDGKGSDSSRTRRWFAECCGCAPEAIDSLHVRDFTRLSSVIWGFTD